MNLYPHQKRALEMTESKNKVAYYLDMGLGKTFIGSEKMEQLKSTVNLVICQKSKIDDWVEHFQKYYAHVPDFVYDMTNKGQFEAFFMHASVSDSSDCEKCYGVINYDLVFRRPELLSLERFTLMLDESSIIQNEKAKRSKFILKMRPDNVILLSGTPTAGKYEKLWSQIHLLGWEISKRLYYQHYVEMEYIETSGFKIPKVIGYKNVDRLKRKLADYGAVFMKSDEVFDLPKQTVIQIYSKATNEYKRFMKDEIIVIEGRELIGDTILSKRIYARMLCSYLNKERIAAFTDLVQSTEDRLIVFYTFNSELNVMMSIAYKFERSVSVVNGHEKDLTAYEEDESSITFVQYQAGSKGLNLQKANKIIYFSLTDHVDDWMQSQKRIHRIGQDRACFYYVMMCPGTVEEKIYEALLRGENYTDELFRKDCYDYING